MKNLLALLVLLTISLGLSAVEKAESLEAAAKMASKTDKPILIDFYAVWCGPCKAFTKASKNDSDIKAALEKVILVKIDAEKGDGIALAEKYEVQGFPTFVLMDKKMRPINTWMGYSKEMFLESLNNGLKNLIPIDARLARYKETKTVEDALALSQYAYSKNQLKDAINYLKDAQAMKPDQGDSFEADILYYTLRGIQTKTMDTSFQDFSKQLDTFISNDNIEAADKLSLVFMVYRSASRIADESARDKYLKISHELSSQDAEASDYLAALKPDFALFIQKDTTAAIALKKEALGDNWQEKPSKLNSFAWWCFENKINLAEARKLAEKGANLESDPKSKAMILDTWAELAHAMGDTKEAVSIIQKAIENNPSSDFYKEQLERFQKEATKDGVTKSSP